MLKKSQNQGQNPTDFFLSKNIYLGEQSLTLTFSTTLIFEKLNLLKSYRIHKTILNILYMYVDFQPKIFLFFGYPMSGQKNKITLKLN